MWRHLPGVSKPPTKRKNTDEDEAEAVTLQKKRTFCEKWRFGDNSVSRGWLHYNAEGAVMSCNVCRQYAKGVIGNKTMKLENIRDHERSKCHYVTANYCYVCSTNV
ncbi:hypothetical protein ABVT39_020170 [Epinephelus coioides]